MEESYQKLIHCYFFLYNYKNTSLIDYSFHHVNDFLFGSLKDFHKTILSKLIK